jgi:hypothetical protein
VEPILFVLCVYGVILLAFGRMGWRLLRDVLRERRVRGYCRELIGQQVGVARELFGEPFSVSPGRGRTLLEWKSPPSPNFPGGSGLLIFYVVVGADGRIAEASWQTRSEGKWRSGTAGQRSGGPIG